MNSITEVLQKVSVPVYINKLLMIKIYFIAFISLLLSCNKGVWLTQNVYRPKNPKFSVLNKTFVANDLINTNYIYTSTQRFVNYDSNILILYIGFYPDGRMLVDNTWEKEMNKTLEERNSFKSASSIGYYTTEGDKIIMEYFISGDGGQYITIHGIIKKDTIIFTEKWIPHDTLVLSQFILME